MIDPVRPIAIEDIEQQARSAALREAREAVRGLPSGWTRPEDQFGPKQYEWLYKEDVLRVLGEETP